MLSWLTANATSAIVILCTIILCVRQSLILREIADFRKLVLKELLNSQLNDEDHDLVAPLEGPSRFGGPGEEY
jgi:hypothetical protein